MNYERKIICCVHSHYLKNRKKIFDSGRSLHFDFLNHYFEDKYTVLRHSLLNCGESRLYPQGINGTYKKIPSIGSLPGPLRYFSEIIFNFFYILKRNPSKITFYAIDPLSCFSASLIKKLGFKIKIFFLTPDYTEERFSNKLLNRAYLQIDKFCTINCDKNICNSEEVIKYKMKKYELNRGKFFHMPNIPNPWLIDKLKKNKKTKGRIIYVGLVGSQIDFINLFDSIKKIKKTNHSAHLVIIGSGNKEEELKNYVSFKKWGFITFLGNLSHEETLKEISKSELGIALYNGSMSYDSFRDSCKIREYQSLGVVPITTGVVLSNVKEIKKFNSGIIISNEKEMKRKLEQFFSCKKYSDLLRINSIKNFEIYKDKYEELYNLLKNGK